MCNSLASLDSKTHSTQHLKLSTRRRGKREGGSRCSWIWFRLFATLQFHLRFIPPHHVASISSSFQVNYASSLQRTRQGFRVDESRFSQIVALHPPQTPTPPTPTFLLNSEESGGRSNPRSFRDTHVHCGGRLAEWSAVGFVHGLVPVCSPSLAHPSTCLDVDFWRRWPMRRNSPPLCSVSPPAPNRFWWRCTHTPLPPWIGDSIMTLKTWFYRHFHRILQRPFKWIVLQSGGMIWRRTSDTVVGPAQFLRYGIICGVEWGGGVKMDLWGGLWFVWFCIDFGLRWYRD